jgi:hypothetical protein
MGNHDPIFFAVAALMGDQLAVFVGHLQAIDHHEGSDLEVESRAAHLQQIVQVGVFEIKLTGQFIVLFIKRAPGDEDAYSHFCALNKGNSNKLERTLVGVKAG